VVKQEYRVKKEAPKDRGLDLNTINKNLISMLKNLAISDKYIGQLVVTVDTKSKQKKLELPKSSKNYCFLK
jgi:hypothetical protein